MIARNSSTSRASRARSLADLQGQTFDVLVVGGGIVGSGVARDAAMRGLKVALVDQHDFAFGTSSRSSRLLHGGLRYLAQGRIGLVREASLEKRVLAKIAPHLAKPLPFIFPTYRGTDWPLWKLRIGVKLYDLLCSGKNLGKSSALDADRTIQSLPGLSAESLTGAVRYFDGLTSDARLVLDTLRSAANHGATVANYVRLTNPRHETGVWVVDAEDRMGGANYPIRTRTVVNAAGPWAQGFGPSAVKLRRTKGVHLVIDRQRLPVADAVVLTEGKRILFVIPWGDRVILGTTDTDYDDANEGVRTDTGDVDYILDIVNRAFPHSGLTPHDVKSCWAGLRPLIASANGKPSDISRNHQIRSPRSGWWDVAGGKLTTYRLMAEQTVDRIVDEQKFNASASRTAHEPLLPTTETRFSGVVPLEISQAAVSHFCANEWAMHLDDVMVRRSSWAYYFPEQTDAAEEVSRWMANELGWDEVERLEEVRQYQSLPLWPRRGVVELSPARAASSMSKTVK